MNKQLFYHQNWRRTKTFLSRTQVIKCFSWCSAFYAFHLCDCVLQTFLDFDFSEWHFLILQSFINIICWLIRFAAKPHLDFLAKSIQGLRGDSLLRWQHSYYLCPVVCLTCLFEFVANCIDYPVCEQFKEEVGIRSVIFLVVYRPKVQVGLQLTICTFYYLSSG